MEKATSAKGSESHLASACRIGTGAATRGRGLMSTPITSTPEPPAHLFQNQACGASHIQDPSDRQRIVMNRANNEVCVPHPTVDAGNVAVCAFHQFIWKAVAVEYFGLILSYHPIEL